MPEVKITEVPEVETVEIDELRITGRERLAELCRQFHLSRAGSADDLRRRVRAKLLGGDSRHVHGGNLCQCGEVMLVTHTVAGLYRRLHCRHCGLREKRGW